MLQLIQKKTLGASAAWMTVITMLMTASATAQSNARSVGNSASGGNLELTVQVTGVRSAEGQLLVAVFNQADGFPREMSKALVSAKVDPRSPNTTFKNMTPGQYAVVVIHDRNGSGAMDKNMMGMPTEPVGLSNYQTLGFSNRPDFRKAVFAMQQSGKLQVKLISL